MTPKVFAGSLILAVITLAIWMAIPKSKEVNPPDLSPDESSVRTVAIANAVQGQENAPEIQGDLPAKSEQIGKSGLSEPDTQHMEYVEARVNELLALSRRHDRVSLETLLSEVRNPENEIRQAALEALMQSGNRDAIPRLEELASQTDDTEQKSDILEAVEFLKLPTLTDVLARSRSMSRAKGATTGGGAGAPNPDRGKRPP